MAAKTPESFLKKLMNNTMKQQSNKHRRIFGKTTQKIAQSSLNVVCHIVLLLIVLSGCNSKNTLNDCSGMVLTTVDRKDTFGFNELIDTFKIVKLETTSESIFGDITKLEILNDTIIIFDSDNQLVLTYDLNGKFLGKIGNRGNGPNEFLNIRSIAIDRIKSKVLLLDDSKLKVFHFKSDGRFAFSEDAVVYPHDFALENNQLIYFQEKNPTFFDKKITYDLLVTKSGQILNKYFPFSQNISFRFPLNRVFYEVNDTVCFIDKWNSKVYSIVNGKIMPRFCIDFMGYNIPLEYTEDEKVFDLYRKKYSYLYDYVIENNSYVYFSYFKLGEVRRVLYNKKDKSYHTFSSNYDKLDLFSSTFAPIYSYNDFFVSVIPPFLMIEAEKNNFLNNSRIKIETSKMDLSDNLILMLYKFKE
jgi:hypothetical protein